MILEKKQDILNLVETARFLHYAPKEVLSVSGRNLLLEELAKNSEKLLKIKYEGMNERDVYKISLAFLGDGSAGIEIEKSFAKYSEMVNNNLILSNKLKVLITEILPFAIKIYPTNGELRRKNFFNFTKMKLKECFVANNSELSNRIFNSLIPSFAYLLLILLGGFKYKDSNRQYHTSRRIFKEISSIDIDELYNVARKIPEKVEIGKLQIVCDKILNSTDIGNRYH